MSGFETILTAMATSFLTAYGTVKWMLYKPAEPVELTLGTMANPEVNDQPAPEVVEQAKESGRPYSVDGVAPRVPWKQKQQELRAQRRTKRAELESLREA